MEIAENTSISRPSAAPSTGASASSAEYSRIVARLHDGLRRLESACRPLEIAPLAGREWYDLLTDKLLPQLADDAYLVVAVVGGTNIGKSVIFNHIAGYRASGASPLASGTKHPVCIGPEGFSAAHDLEGVFPDFVLEEWVDTEGALTEDPVHRLFWQERPETPANLLILDTPDIDSDAPVNWRRAAVIRRSADVLIAVLTQQKYNDAAVKQFFRKAADEDKVVIVIFNQCQLPEDEEYWPLWLRTFSDETGVRPHLVYLAPYDRRAAEDNTLSFTPRRWPREDGEIPEAAIDGEHNLRTALSQLHFAQIKLRTLRGSLLHLLHPELGVNEYLNEVRRRSAEFESAGALLSQQELAHIDDWPPLPDPVLIAEIRSWWRAQREGWPARVHGFYNTLGRGLAWPVRFARARMRGPAEPPLEAYRRQEWDAIVGAVGRVYERLTFVSKLGNELLRPRLDRVLGGTSRAELLRRLQAEHDQADLARELQELVARELTTFHRESPQFYAFLQRLDAVAAAARPATSIVLFVAGFGPLGDAVAPLITDAAMQSVAHVAGDVAGGTVAATVGETAISSTAASGAGYLEAKFRRLQQAFVAGRAAWLAGVIEQHLLGSLGEELQSAARIPQSESYERIRGIIEELEAKL